MKTKEVADICGVTEECIRQNAKKIGMEFGYGEFTNHDWTEGELKKIQMQLMANSNNQGSSNEIVKSNSKAALELGALTIAATQSVEATQQLCNVLMLKVQQFEALQLEQQKTKELEQKNLLLIEQKEAAEAETERIFKYNENFHNHLYTATDLAKMLGTNPNKIGRIATKFHLKQEPIYGKLGKMQVKNGRWVDIFYYNEDAKLVIENNL